MIWLGRERPRVAIAAGDAARADRPGRLLRRSRITRREPPSPHHGATHAIRVAIATHACVAGAAIGAGASPVAPAAGWTTAILGAVGVAGVGMIAWGARRWRVASGSYRPIARPAGHELESLRDDLRELADRLSVELASRSDRLEALVDRAERVAQRLDAHAARATPGEERTGRASPPGVAVSPGAAVAPPPGERSAPFKSFGWHDADPVRDQLRDQLRDRARAGEARAPGADPFHREVLELAHRGESAHDIAQKLGRPIGQVELVLGLHAAVTGSDATHPGR